ncbi:MAG: pyridoxamine 5'-phosphate oxidase family protein [Candidatus Lokiarchaeota archaeon]
MKNLTQEVKKILIKNNWLVLSTVDKENKSHSSVVVYQSDGKVIYCQTGADTLKIKNIEGNNHISVAIPFRKNFLHKLIPAPPAEIHFSTSAEIRPEEDEEARIIYQKYLKYEEMTPSGVNKVWIRIQVPDVVGTYGVGVRLLKMKKPEEAQKVVMLN